MDIRRGDTVKVLTGKDKGKQGAVESVLREKHKVVITGINIMKRHVKPNAKYPSGGIIETAYPIDWSNIQVVEGKAETNTKAPKKVKK